MKKTPKPSAPKIFRQTIIPPSISKGDTIGLVAPAGPLYQKSKFTAGVRFLEKKGFRLKYNSRLLNARGYLAGSDQERADEFNSLWADPEVKALVAARGGYGCLRLLDLINMRQIRQNPKILIGFSDLTVLLAAIYKKTGLVTYHGPVVTTLAGIDRKSQASFLNILAGKPLDLISPAGLKILKKGKAEGILLGGNLTTLVHMMATPYEIPWNQAILFLEDVGESPYRLDRFLTHLNRAGRLQKIKGLILGTFSDEDGKGIKNDWQASVNKRVLELLHHQNIPIWTNFPVGHTGKNLTMPIGTPVTMDSSDGKLCFNKLAPGSKITSKVLKGKTSKNS